MKAELAKVKIDPLQPDSAGIIVDGTDVHPRIGIWLMPDNESRGELEDFIRRMIPADDPVWSLASHYIDSIPTEHRKFKTAKNEKAKVYAWLAARKKPSRMGAAMSAGDLCIDQEIAMKFACWLRRLFAWPATKWY